MDAFHGEAPPRPLPVLLPRPPERRVRLEQRRRPRSPGGAPAPVPTCAVPGGFTHGTASCPQPTTNRCALPFRWRKAARRPGHRPSWRSAHSMGPRVPGNSLDGKLQSPGPGIFWYGVGRSFPRRSLGALSRLCRGRACRVAPAGREARSQAGPPGPAISPGFIPPVSPSPSAIPRRGPCRAAGGGPGPAGSRSPARSGCGAAAVLGLLDDLAAVEAGADAVPDVARPRSPGGHRSLSPSP